ncbi:Transcription-repair-coupling factor [Moorella thermoacetica]|uniref:transcription-repair coupling factor n=1 Tax=Neomoorella thermoacetica TaxID=1525 RepID=UPI0011E66A37|nr:transcription-repair coupling factor [Moorella thermoacetica]TYL09888.1 Transcription-repair-coupling factor [Moorella thermoacetica]
MYNNSILQIIRDSEQFYAIAGGLRRGAGEVQLYGLPEGMKGLWLAAMLDEFNPILVVTPGSEEAQRLAADIESFWPGEGIDYLPPSELLPLEVYTPSPELAAQRLKVLTNLVSGRTRILVVPVEDLLRKLPPPDTLRHSLQSLEVGQIIDREALLQKLTGLGYRREEVVEAPGQLAVRGGIIDIFPLGAEEPVRLELFGDEIDSLRRFDPVSQRSVADLRAIVVGPAQEVLPPPDLGPGLETLKAEFSQTYATLRQRQPQAARELKDRVQELIAMLEAGSWPGGSSQLQPFFYPRQATLFEYFQRQPLLVLDDPARLLEEMRRREQQRLGIFTDMLAAGLALPSQGQAYLDSADLERLWQRYQRLYFSLLPRRVPGSNPRPAVGISAQTIPAFQGKLGLVVEELTRWRREGYRIILMVADPNRVVALRQALAEQGIEALTHPEARDTLGRGEVIMVSGRLRQGFTWPEMRLAIIGDTEIYGPIRRPRRVKTPREGSKISSFTDLKEGDYVVHVHHGIGRYLGLQQLDVGGVKKDYLLIQYAGKDRLYVPVDQVSLVQKYVGGEGHVPRLYRLGGNEWNKVKSRVQEAVQEMAQELLDLYARREAIPGHAFGPDTPWQREFEEAFPYTETPDQLRAIAEVKADMEKPRPMDRLLCGDVGYGKTEVAMRAAFKAVMDGMQVAVLVPTTILAQQHYETFKARFAPFPVKIAVLSCFCSPREQKVVVEALKRGEVDIVIGTHRLLSSDVNFKNLGLVIIDEEQRFGVAHKEKLKQLRYSVDVLTMTATPIPRTLHMSLAGVRDMSMIETPPEDRFPVQTYVVEYNPELVREAIRRELDRGGQVFIVHNRVQDIDRFAYHIQQLVPEARVGIGHGQMGEEELENVMLDFISGRYDVLVSTTIVENGLDIQNANTLIVDESDNFGLAQLYQLRGRVGRTNRLAYAYFTYRPDKVLGEIAEKRLAAIREFTAFGSGYKIALRDLQIRGAGNFLGPEQHGHMVAVGFDLYCQLLEEAVRKLKEQRGEGVPRPALAEPQATPIELSVDTFLGDNYIPEATLKMELYHRLMNAGDLAAVEDIAAEMEDRYGPPPPEARNLLALTRVRILAREVGVISVNQKNREVELSFGQHTGLRGEKLLQLNQYFPRKLAFSSAGGLTIRVRVMGLSQEELLDLLEKVLTRIKYLVIEAAS